jgi:flavin reductase (DIM6/NTAB) family NADH-FMN oxidoreductase RutF
MLMRNVPSSVAVITAQSYDSELKCYVPMGVAVSSLSTVSLDPPTISFNIKQPSKTLDAIRRAGGRFRVHFPAADRGGANIVDLFSRGNHQDAYTMRLRGLTNVHLPGEYARAGRLRASASGAPQILNDSVRAAMECTLTQEQTVADHVILVAKVDSLESRRQGSQGDRTILYVDGSYMRPDGSKIAFHQNTKAIEDEWSIWDYPLFPGEEERRDYMERIKTIIKKHPQIMQHGKQSISQLEAMLPLSPSKWGINLEQLIEKCRGENGMPPTLPPHLKDLPILSDFYGRLSPSDRAKMAERVKTLVKVDNRFLSLNYRLFLQNMGISAASVDLLPSDIAEPLRAEGLLGPPHPTSEPLNPKGGPYDLLHFEQIEKRLLEHLRTMTLQKLLGSQLDQVIESLGEPRFVATYFKRSRARLYAATYTDQFQPRKFDIAGEVSPEEARVVLSRFLRYMEVENTTTFRIKVHLDYHEILRGERIHPSITGFDVEYLAGKLNHLHLTTRLARDLPGRIDQMIEPWFTSVVAWPDLEQRVHSFVHKMPMQAMAWSTKDKLAAMGLHQNAVLDVTMDSTKPFVANGHVSSTRPFVRNGDILDTIVARELKNLYGNATPKLNQVIARFLKSEYDFDINEGMTVSEGVTDSLAQAPHQSSGDDMLEAMVARRTVNKKSDKSEFEDSHIRGIRERFRHMNSAERLRLLEQLLNTCNGQELSFVADCLSRMPTGSDNQNSEMHGAPLWRRSQDVRTDGMDGLDSGEEELLATAEAQDAKRKRW